MTVYICNNHIEIETKQDVNGKRKSIIIEKDVFGENGVNAAIEIISFLQDTLSHKFHIIDSRDGQ